MPPADVISDVGWGGKQLAAAAEDLDALVVIAEEFPKNSNVQ